MANIKMFKLLGVLVALLLIIWAVLPFLRHQPITTDVIATAIILIMISYDTNPIIIANMEYK